PEYAIELDAAIYYVTGDADDVVKITGVVVDSDEDPVSNVRVQLVKGSDIYDIDRTDKNGGFTLTLPGDVEIDKYAVSVDYADDEEFYVVPELTSDDELEVAWDELEDEDFAFQYAGRLAFVDHYTGVTLKGSALKGELEFGVAKNGRFFLFAETDDFDKVGDLELWLTGEGEGEDLLLAKGKVAPAKVNLKLNTTSIVYDLDQTLVATVDLSEAYPEGHDWEVKGSIRNADGGKLADSHNANEEPEIEEEDGEYTITFNFEDLVRTDAGEYQVLIQAFKDDGDTKACYEGTATFSVVRPTSGKLYGMPTSITVAKGLNLTFDEDHIYVLYREAGVYKVAEYYKVSCEGVVEKDWQDIDPDNTTFTAAPKKAGTITVTVKAYEDEDYEVLIGTFTAEVKVEGGYITVDPDTVQVDSKETITLTVVDDDEDPVNNAYIYFTEHEFGEFDPADPEYVYLIDPTKVNIKQGVYTLDLGALKSADRSDIVGLPETWNIFAVQGGKVIAAGTLKVEGQNIYEVELNVDTVLAGLDAKFKATVTDDDGNPVTIDKNDLTITNPKGKNHADVTVSKTTKGTIEFTVKNLLAAGEYTVNVSTDDGKYLGKATFEVVLPELNLNVEKVTNNVNTKLTFVLTNPITGKELDWEIDVQGDAYTKILEATLNGDELPVVTADEDPDLVELYYDDEYELVLLVKADLKAAANDKKTAAISFVANDVVLAKLPVEDAVLAANPEVLTFGAPNTVTLTLTDANGQPLEGYKVVCGSWTAKTDENGQVIHVVPAVSSEPVEFVVTLDGYTIDEDDDKVAVTLTKALNTNADLQAPEIVYEPVVGTPTAIVKIVDNVRLLEVRIDGEKVDLLPGAKEYVHEFKLNLGVNNFHIQAVDINYNPVDTVIEIEYKGIQVPAENLVRRGDYLLVQLRQFEALDVVCDWDPETATGTFTYGDNVVAVTNGSKIAIVNGEEVEMPVAAEIIEGRFYVPVRFVGEDGLGLHVYWQPGDIVIVGA
ncbi:MAG: stalk domain-containing protein, partial [Bacillota bacterium]